MIILAKFIQRHLLPSQRSQRFRIRGTHPPVLEPILHSSKSATLGTTIPSHAPSRRLFPPLKHLPRRRAFRAAFGGTECL